jgi:hypothetical protein
VKVLDFVAPKKVEYATKVFSKIRKMVKLHRLSDVWNLKSWFLEEILLFAIQIKELRTNL